MTRSFPLRVLLTVTTGRLLTKSKGDRNNGIGDLYELLGYMTDDSPMTHQLGRFAEECKPWLLRWFPELVDYSRIVEEFFVTFADAPKDKRPFLIEGMILGLGKQDYDVPKIPAADHESKDPYDELVAMRGTDEGIVVIKTEEPE